MTTANPDDYCYRHPGRRSFVLCQRCARTICPECQVQAPVGVHCVECARAESERAQQAHREAIRQRGGDPRAYQTASGAGRWLQPFKSVTGVIIGVTTLAGLAQWLVPNNLVGNLLAFYAPFAAEQPWRFLTVALVHFGVLHFALNMFSLYILGPNMERSIGRGLYLASYAVCAVAGSVAAGLISPEAAVVGASGAIFGLLGMYLGLQRQLGRINPTLIIVIVANLAIGMVLGGISWQSHVGGLIAGIALGYAIAAGLKQGRRGRAWQWLGAIAGVVVVLAVIVAIIR